MKAKDVPPFHEALQELAPYFRTFYDAFEGADTHVKDFLDGLKAPFDPWIHAHLVRHYVKIDLQKHDVDAQEFKPENLAMSGLQFRIGRWFIRMRKSVRGEVPPPGRSRTMNAYYRQLTLSGEFSKVYILLLLWNANLAGDFKGLSLVFPFTPDVMKWKVDIPHPAKTEDEATTIYQSDLDDVGNLPIESLEEDFDDNQAEDL
jgi:hypothetical protein